MPSEATTAPILAQLLDHPEGMTAKEIAAALDWTAVKASRVLGMMFFAGELDRRSKPSRTNNEFVYTIRPEKPKAPPTVQWVPQHEPAEPKPLPAWAKQYADPADELAGEDAL